MCNHELREQVRVVFLVHMAMNVLEIVMARLQSRVTYAITQSGRLFTLPPKSFSVDVAQGKARISHFVQEAMEKSPYGELEVDGTLFDFLGLVVLYSHVILFSVVFPLAPLCGTIVLVLKMRMDGLKLFHLLR